MGAITTNTKTLTALGKSTDQIQTPKKKIKPMPIAPTPKPTAIPLEIDMQKTIEGFKKKGWIK
jgi:hypothetical protein